MQTASFLGAIRTIVYIIAFYYVFKFAMRLLLPVLLKKAVEKAEENLRQRDFGQPNNNPYREQQKPKVDSRKEEGEYVDFEEIE
ncbi:MAG: DUF4834 domain-containing protein [Flavobacterium sp.]|nr:MAG: DUF4834 domain-containing protein [Flavobacterium sp.]